MSASVHASVIVQYGILKVC